MASTGNNGLLNKDKLKPGLEALAAEILRRDKNISKVKIEEKIKVTASAGAGKPAPSSAKSATGEKATADKPAGKTEPEQKPDGAEKQSENQKDSQAEGREEKGGEEPKQESQAEEKGEKAPDEKPEEQTGAGPEEGGQEADKEEGEEGDKKEDEKKDNEEGGDKEDGEKDNEKTGEEGKEKDGEGEKKEEDKKDGEEGEKDGDKKAGGQETPGGKAGEEAKPQAGQDNSRLANPEQENDAAGKLREEKGEGEEEPGEEGAEEQGSFGQAIRKARNLKEQAKRAKEEMVKKVLTPAKAGFSNILRNAWLGVGTVIGSIFAIFYINAHVLLKSIFGEKLFCKLGEEWLPPQTAEATGEAGRIVNKSIGIVEVMILLFVDVIIAFIIVCIVALFVDKDTFNTMTGESAKTQQTPTIQQTK